ncbi:hypothetical protein FGO68_gene2932 [Halteria grandinella]|uniref:Uncharacterized protein n=1 Tax=Halteria grandinella TaxID=5974 RepID=A0A8J8NBA5_HALGN|nr:hypothetical protein FGO68_gene2932 [Halteria grandinella]
MLDIYYQQYLLLLIADVRSPTTLIGVSSIWFSMLEALFINVFALDDVTTLTMLPDFSSIQSSITFPPTLNQFCISTCFNSVCLYESEK